MGEGGRSQSNIPKNAYSFKVSLCGKKKRVKRGKWKGYEGIIKNISGQEAKFELSAICKTITIPLNYLNIPKMDLEIGSGLFNTDRARTQMGATTQSNMKQNMMTPAYEPINQFGDWGEN